MDIFKRPENMFSLSALAVSSGTAMYTYTKIKELNETVDKLTAQINVIGKAIGQLKTDSTKINEMESVVHEVDRTLLSLKKEFEDTLELQQVDNQVLEEYINNVVKIAKLEDVPELQLENIEEQQPKKRGKKNKRKVRFAKPAREESEDDEDEVTTRLERMRRRRV